MVLSGLVFEPYYISIHIEYWSVMSQEWYIYNKKYLDHMLMYLQICLCVLCDLACVSHQSGVEKCCKLCNTLVLKGYRIVCATVHLHSYDSLYKVNSVMNNAMYLRTASQSVSILHSVTETVTFWYKKK